LTLRSRQAVAALLTLILSSSAFGEGFNANFVRIQRTLSGMYRVTIRYSHLEVGEYRESFVEYKTKKEAEGLYEKLKNGADFRQGNFNKLPRPTGINQDQKPF
jgi:hypothetical protein